MTKRAAGAASGTAASTSSKSTGPVPALGKATGSLPALGKATGGIAALRPRRFRSLASRLVALGLVQLALLAATAVVIFFAEGPHDQADPEEKLTAVVVARLEQLVDSPTELTAALDALREQRVEVSLYDESRQLIASNVDPALAPPPRPPWRHGRPEDRDRDRQDRGDRNGQDRDRNGQDRDRNAQNRGSASPDRNAQDRGSAADRNAQDRGSAADRNAQDRGSATADRSASPDRNAPSDRGGPPPPDGFGPPGDPPPPGPRGPDARGPDARFPGGPGGPDDATAARNRWLASRHRLLLPYHAHGQRGLLVARGVHGKPPGFTGPILVLICGALILVVGALITARWIVRPIERLSRTAKALGSGDLQARSRLDRDDEIGQLGHRFDEMAERITGLLVTEKELLANVAHELRTPLTRIGVALDLANEGDAEAARASLVEIAVDVSELETIVDDILTAMRFEIAPGKAQLPLRRAIVPAAEIAEAAAERLRARHPNRTLEVSIADDLPALHVDPVLFRRVIDNLIENAHKYTPNLDAPIELDVRRETDDANGAPRDAVAFEIRDRGVGISAEDLPRIFTAFFRGERSRSRETGGVGLGLTLAKRIVEAHDGTIAVSSAVNVGTAIRVTLPGQR